MAQFDTLADRRVAFLEMRKTAADLRADGVLTSSSQAVTWDRLALETIEPIVEIAARALLAEQFGGAKYGHPPDGEIVDAHVAEDTAQWKAAKHHALAILEAVWTAEAAEVAQPEAVA